MTYSVESLLFKAVVGVVNTAARAANAALQVMYPQDVGHVWEDEVRPAARLAGSTSGTAAQGADPHPARAADPAGVVPLAPAGSLTWENWAVPAILDVLAEAVEGNDDLDLTEWIDWSERVAPVIARRIACDPTRAALALTSLQTQ